MPQRLTKDDFTTELCESLLARHGSVEAAAEAIAPNCWSESIGKSPAPRTVEKWITAKAGPLKKLYGAINDPVADAAAKAEIDQAALDNLRPLVSDKKAAVTRWQDVLSRAAVESSARRAEDPSQTHAKIDLSHEKGLVGIFLISDVHFGSPQCDYLTFLQHAKYLTETRNLYAIIQGDILEWSISQRMMDATLNQVFPPSTQARVVRSLVKDIARKTLAAVMGNHEGRVERFAGFDLGEFIYDELRKTDSGVYLKDGGSLRIALSGGVSYSWNVMHGDSRFGSMYNPNHKSFQLSRMSFGFHDIQSTGHTHEAAVQQIRVPGQDGNISRVVTSLQAGSYKVMGYEQYPHRLGFQSSPRVEMPMVIIDSKQHAVIPFLRVEEGVRALAAMSRKAA